MAINNDKVKLAVRRFYEINGNDVVALDFEGFMVVQCNYDDDGWPHTIALAKTFVYEESPAPEAAKISRNEYEDAMFKLLNDDDFASFILDKNIILDIVELYVKDDRALVRCYHNQTDFKE